MSVFHQQQEDNRPRIHSTAAAVGVNWTIIKQKLSRPVSGSAEGPKQSGTPDHDGLSEDHYPGH